MVHMAVLDKHLELVAYHSGMQVVVEVVRILEALVAPAVPELEALVAPAALLMLALVKLEHLILDQVVVAVAETTQVTTDMMAVAVVTVL
jgi:hypothetical protein